MRKRCPESKLVGKVVLKDYKIGFTIFSPQNWKAGCADILEASGEEVWGLLYEVSDSDLEHLDKAEGHPDIYRRLTVNVKDDAGVVYTAEAYEVASKEGEFIKPSRRYLGIMQKAAKDFNFPTDYTSILSAIPTSN